MSQGWPHRDRLVPGTCMIDMQRRNALLPNWSVHYLYTPSTTERGPHQTSRPSPDGN